MLRLSMILLILPKIIRISSVDHLRSLCPAYRGPTPMDPTRDPYGSTRNNKIIMEQRKNFHWRILLSSNGLNVVSMTICFFWRTYAPLVLKPIVLCPFLR